MNTDEVRVVVVDDALDMAEALAAVLELDGYSVVTAGDARNALIAVERHRPHCVLFDINMPGTGGCELSRQFRERYGDDIILIAVTRGRAQNKRVAETFARVDHYLMKPVDPKELRRVLGPL
jgi:DNA-binding response OmpR family regulator